jgi:hypothetical protein
MEIVNFIVDYGFHFIVFLLKAILFLGAYLVMVGLLGNYLIKDK